MAAAVGWIVVSAAMAIRHPQTSNPMPWHLRQGIFCDEIVRPSQGLSAFEGVPSGTHAIACTKWGVPEMCQKVFWEMSDLS